MDEQAKVSAIAQNVVYGVLQNAVAKAYGVPVNAAFNNVVTPITFDIMHNDKKYSLGVKFVSRDYVFAPPIFGERIKSILKFISDWCRALVPEIAKEANILQHREFKFGLDPDTRGFIYTDDNPEMYYEQDLIGFYMVETN